MKKSLAPFIALALLIGLAIGLAVSGVSVTSDAAEVNGASITQSQLNSVLHESTSSALFNCLLTQGTTPTKGAGVTSTFSSGYAAQQLSLLINHSVIEGALTKLHLQPTSLARSIANQQLASGLTSQTGSSCTATGAQVVASLPVTYRNLLINIQLDQDLLDAHLAGATLTNAGIAAYSKIHPNVTELACVSAILVAKKSTAQTLDAQLRGGASFSALAKANSTDATSAAAGGALGCYYPGEFSGTLGNAVSSLALNQPSAPVLFSSNWVILEVTQRQPGTAAGAALALVSGESAAGSAYAATLNTKDRIWVNSQYGHWGHTKTQDQVVAPTGPKNADLVNSYNLTPLGAVYQ